MANVDQTGLFGLGFESDSSTEVGRGRGNNLRMERQMSWGVDAYNIINEEKEMPVFESPIMFIGLFFLKKDFF